MTNIPRGPEDMPLQKYVAEFPMVIILKDVKSGRSIREERINYSDNEARRWLGRITYFACTNGYSVETMAEKDYNVDKV